MPNKNILILDDEIIILDVLSEAIKKMGYNTNTAQTSHQAIELYKNNKYDLVIIDLIIHDGINGESCSKIFKTINNKVNILISSGNINNEIIKRFNKLGITHFIKKPYSFQFLENKINEIIGK